VLKDRTNLRNFSDIQVGFYGNISDKIRNSLSSDCGYADSQKTKVQCEATGIEYSDSKKLQRIITVGKVFKPVTQDR